MAGPNPLVTVVRVQDGTLSVEFRPDTGRLRMLDGAIVLEELFPPHSWFAIASVAGNSRWGTRPSEADLQLLLEDFIHRRSGTSDRGHTAPT